MLIGDFDCPSGGMKCDAQDEGGVFRILWSSSRLTQALAASCVFGADNLLAADSSRPCNHSSYRGGLLYCCKSQQSITLL